MGPINVAPDALELVRSALLASFPTFGETVQVVTRVPSTRPDEFFRIDAAGGDPRQSYAPESFRLLLEAYAVERVRASRLLNLGIAILFAQEGPLFGAAKYGGPTNLPDPAAPSHVRYTASMAVRARATRTA